MMVKHSPRIEINMKLVTWLFATFSFVASAGFWTIGYHSTLATKKQVNLIFVDMRINAAQDNLFRYDEMGMTKGSQRRRYAKIQSKLVLLERQRDDIIGLKE